MAGRCMVAFVDPEMAAWTIMAFSKLFMVTISRALIPCDTSCISCFPAFLAAASSSGGVEGISAVPGNISPSASAIICMVEAVPIKEQAPQLGHA